MEWIVEGGERNEFNGYWKMGMKDRNYDWWDE